MSYTELESGYQGLRQQNQPGFYVGQDGNIVSYVSAKNKIVKNYFVNYTRYMERRDTMEMFRRHLQRRSIFRLLRCL